jgi:hypothetical protein
MLNPVLCKVPGSLKRLTSSRYILNHSYSPQVINRFCQQDFLFISLSPLFLINEEAKALYRAVENTTTMGCDARKKTYPNHVVLYISLS